MPTRLVRDLSPVYAVEMTAGLVEMTERKGGGANGRGEVIVNTW